MLVNATYRIPGEEPMEQQIEVEELTAKAVEDEWARCSGEEPNPVIDERIDGDTLRFAIMVEGDRVEVEAILRKPCPVASLLP